MSSACLHAEPTLCTVQPHICSLIYIRRTSFTSVLNLSRVINFKGEISLFTSVSESALSQGKSFNFQTNKRPLMHIFRCQLSIQCVSCLILPFVLSSVFGRPCGALFVPWKSIIIYYLLLFSLHWYWKRSDLQRWSSVQLDVHVTAENSCVGCVCVCVCAQSSQTSQGYSLTPVTYTESVT